MSFELLPLSSQHILQFKKDMQEAFQQGAVEYFNAIDIEILPEKDIDHSLSAKGSFAYEARLDRKLVGGAVVVIDNETKHNHLDFLYVKKGIHSKGVGLSIWNAIETLYPETKIWETHTPSFEKRNIHFYVNKCSFHIVEYFNKHHKNPHETEAEKQFPNMDYFSEFFRFEKENEIDILTVANRKTDAAEPT